MVTALVTPPISITTNTLDYDVYDCSQATSCGLCAHIHPRCGWCSELASCMDQSTCTASSPASSWERDDCPFISSINPPFTALGRASQVLFEGKFYSASAPLSDIRCEYTYNSATELVQANSTESTVTCLLPAVTAANTVMIRVGQMLDITSTKRALTFVPFTDDVFDFDFFSCAPPSNQSSCGECSGSGLDSRCGWCAYDAICADQYSCDDTYTAHFRTPESCPSLLGLTPSEGPLDGGTEITVTATYFIAGTSGTSCSFGSQVVDATVDSESTLRCTSPSASSLGIKKSGESVDVNILWQNAQFARNSGFKFTFKRDNTVVGVIVGVVVGLLALLIIISLIMLAIFYKKIKEKRDRSKFLKLREPDYPAVAFALTKSIEFIVSPSDLKSLGSFIRMLEADTTNFSIVYALSQAAPGSQADYLARSAIYFYQSRGHALDLLLRFVSAEVKSSEHEGTLFRASSFACKLFNQYARYQGLPYLWKTLGFYVNQLAEFAKEERMEERDDILGPGSMEVDPGRFEDQALVPDELDLRLNQYELITRASKILKAIFVSLSYMPPEFRLLCKRVRAEVGAKFTDNNADYKAVGGFIFLRFICPSIMAPHVYGLLTNAPNETAQRYFVLIAKILQNLANQTLPGTNEDFMVRMNEFITKNIDPLHMWIDELCDNADSATPANPDLPIPENLVNSSVTFMQRTLVDEWDNVVKHLPEDDIEDLEIVKDKGPLGKKPKAKSSNPPRRGKNNS